MKFYVLRNLAKKYRDIRIYIIVFDYIFFGKTYVESKDTRYRVLTFIENKNNILL